MKLNIGCGTVQPDGWVNVDNSNRAKLAKRLPWVDRFLVRCRAIPPTEFGPRITLANLLKRWPFHDNTCRAVYAGDVWEHFTEQQAKWLTSEAYRVLAPGGVLRVRTPDGALMWRNYLAAYDKALVTPVDDRESEITEVKRHVWMYFRDICTRRLWFGSIGHFHKWHWDEVQLVDLLRSCGFTNVCRMPYRQSRIDDVDLVEHWDYLQVEGVKQ